MDRVVTRCDGVRFVVLQAEVLASGAVVYHCRGHLTQYATRNGNVTKRRFGPSHKVEEDLVDSVAEVRCTADLVKDLFDQNIAAVKKEGRLGRTRRGTPVITSGNPWADPDTTV